MNSPGVREQQVGVVASFFQIRNERISDLFQASDIGADEPKVRTGSTGRTIVEGLKRFRLRTLQEARECFAHALANQRLLSPGTQVIFSVHLHDLQTTSHPDGAEAPITSSTLLSSLHVVDLPSPSSLPSSMAVDQLLCSKHSKDADKALASWCEVMAALAQQQAKGAGARLHIPFRSSVLTRVLQQSLCNQARTYVLATLSPSPIAFKDSINTFRHLSRLKEVAAVKRINAILQPSWPEPSAVAPAAGGGWRWSYRFIYVWKHMHASRYSAWCTSVHAHVCTVYMNSHVYVYASCTACMHYCECNDSIVGTRLLIRLDFWLHVYMMWAACGCVLL